jgi:hypothetical protein
MLRWCIQQDLIIHQTIAEEVGATGDMSLIQDYLDNYGRKHFWRLFAGAARSGNWAAAVKLYQRLPPPEVERFLGRDKWCLIEGGSVELAQLMNLSLSDFSPAELTPALRKGRLRFVQWVLSEKHLSHEDGKSAVADAAESGSFELVRWLVDEKGFRTDRATESAASGGHLDMLRWLHEQFGCRIRSLDVSAARGNHIHVLNWLAVQGFDPTDEALYTAAACSNIPTVAWILDHGLSYDEQEVLMNACYRFEDENMFSFLVESRGMQPAQECIREAGGLARVAPTLQRLFGLPLSKTHLEQCVDSDDIVSVRQALALDAPLRSSALVAMFDFDQCAMLSEVLEHHLVNGEHPDAVRVALNKAVRRCKPMSERIEQVLERFGYKVRDKMRARWEARWGKNYREW